MAKPPQASQAETGAPSIKDEIRKVADLTADKRNARRHSEAQISQIVAAIDRFGFVDKISIRPDGQIIGGHARLEALKRMGRAEVECRVVSGLSEAGYKALGLALNRIPENSSWDHDILRDLITEIQDEGENAQTLGFGPAELKRILEEPDDLEVKEIETGPVDDEFWISVRGPLAQQANVFKALDAALKQFAGVSVEQGTINIG